MFCVFFILNMTNCENYLNNVNRLFLPPFRRRGHVSKPLGRSAPRGLGAELGAEGFFVFAPAGDAAGVRTVSRMFCPAIGIDEDPVSGNAHAMLARLLWDAGELDAADPAFIGHQGAQLHRPGEVQVRLEIEAGAMRAARIGGAAVIVSEGLLTGF